MPSDDEEILDLDLVPITEWPVTDVAITSNSNETEPDEKDNKFAAGISPSRCRLNAKYRFHSTFHPYKNKNISHKEKSKSIENIDDTRSTCNNIFKRQQSSKTIGKEKESDCMSGQLIQLEPEASREQHASIDIKIARWWRKYSAAKPPDCLPKVGNANTTLYHITRLPKCKEFLLGVKEQLLRESRLIKSSKLKPGILAALAGVEDRLGECASGLAHMENAVQLQPYNPEFLWLKEKLRRQCQIVNEQDRAKISLEGVERKLPLFKQVQRISGRDLTVTEFQDKFVKRREIVIITDVVSEMSKLPFDFSFVKAKAGAKSVRVKKFVRNSVEWARLEDGNMKTVNQFIEEIEEGTTSQYLFDWSLPIHCPELAQELSLPDYFKDNLLLSTSSGSLYRDSWPSLFIAPKGAVSNLHVDTFASHFWMALFEGEKRWTFFDPKDTPLLYPKYFHSMDPVFEIDMGNPDMEKYPLLALTKPQQCVLKPGELLFVPAGSPHYVENLTVSLAVSSNYVNESNLEETCQELEVNALLDPRAKDLLEQFKQPGFARNVP